MAKNISKEGTDLQSDEIFSQFGEEIKAEGIGK